MVGTAVEGETVVVESLAQGVAPVSVVGPDSGAHGVGLAFAHQSHASGIHQVFQHTGSGVVAGDKEHFHGR